MNKSAKEEENIISLEMLRAIQATSHGERIPYYFHNRRSNPSAGIERILREGFPVVGGTFSIIPPLNWGEEMPGNREWQIIRNAFFSVDYLLQAYAETQDQKYFDIAADTAADWVTFNLVQANPNRAKWSDICCGLRAFYFAYILNNDPNLLVNFDRGILILRGALAHSAELLQPKNIAKSNHAIFQALGLASLAEVFSFLPQATEWSKVAVNILTNLIVNQYGKEGVHLEHSPYYHGWVLERIKQVAKMPWFLNSSEIWRTIALAEENYVHFFHPNGSLAEFGESSPATIHWVKNIHPYAEWGTSKGNSGQEPPITDVVHREAGFAIVRDSFKAGLGSSYLIMAAGHHSRSHKQDDCTTFEWSDFGQKIIIDSGKYAYDFDEKRDYVMSRRGHNVVEIEGTKFDASNAYGAGRLSLSYGESGTKILSVSLPNESPYQNIKRKIAIKHGEYIVCVDVIHVPSGKTEICHQRFHLHPSLTQTDKQQESPTFEMDDNIKVYAYSLSDPGKETVQVGVTTPQLQGWMSPNYGILTPTPCVTITKEITGMAVLATLFRVSKEQLVVTSPKVELLDDELLISWADNKNNAIKFSLSN